MKRIINISALCLSALAMIVAVPDAYGRRPGVSGPETNRPVNTTRPGSNGHQPDNNHKPDNGHRPGNSNHRPGNSGHQPGGIRPGTYPTGSHRPGNSGHPVRPGWGNIGPSFTYPTPPPPRPHRPIMRPIPRPVRPAGWIIRPGIPAINGFLGLSFGTGLSVSLNFLNTNGYAVDGYADNTVYLRNVTDLSMLWPDAALYYNNAGLLTASSFYYSTPYNDLSRYNAAYTRLTSIYGTPISTGSTGATWFSSSGYISLTYAASTSPTGGFRYYTTLSYGQ